MTNTTEAAPTGAMTDEDGYVIAENMPETVWATPPVSNIGSYLTFEPIENGHSVEYVRKDTRASDRAAMQAAVEALRDAEETLRLVEHPRQPDRAYHGEVKALGMRIGFGALMSTAEAGWREYLEAKGYPSGGEHVSGPCRGTVDATLSRLRAALDALKGGVRHG